MAATHQPFLEPTVSSDDAEGCWVARFQLVSRVAVAGVGSCPVLGDSLQLLTACSDRQRPIMCFIRLLAPTSRGRFHCGFL